MPFILFNHCIFNFLQRTQGIAYVLQTVSDRDAYIGNCIYCM